MTFRRMKFLIGDDPALSEKVQKALFSLGYGWNGVSHSVKYTEKGSLYTYESGGMAHADVAYFYETKDFEECTIADILPKAKVISLKAMVEKAGGTWSDTEPAKPLLGLKPRCLVDQERIIEILQAMQRFVEKGMPVAAEWFDELEELLKEGRYAV